MEAHNNTLPTELLDIIFAHLRDDNASLRSCSLTCRSWVSPTRVYLLASIRLDLWLHMVRFEALLHDSPHISPYIQRLVVSAYSEEPAALKPAALKLISSIYSRLGAVTDLHIFYNTAVPSTIPPALAAVGPVRRLNISVADSASSTRDNHVTLLMQTLELLPLTEELTYRARFSINPSVDVMDMSILAGIMSRTHLTRLQLFDREVCRLFMGCFKSGSPPGLKVVDLASCEFGAMDLATLSKLILGTARSLKRLNVTGSKIHRSVDWGEVLESCNVLEHVQLDLCPFAMAAKFASRVALPSLLALELDLVYGTKSDGDHLVEFAQSLLNRSRFRSLLRVVLHIRGYADYNRKNALERQFSDTLDPLRKRYALTVTYLFAPPMWS
ncbi:hypothetical protein OBBRIDRAFT_126802 [Obba rivulosa]|uniref:F-box domain-containing protein n=1 Tax=Obba rivulosa TaxID=1052685 RepID=A0A8E2AWE6_9APHY|nr:hypothetical protein OBBRIDRAFT_126802 [Obba rivulosa]